MLKRKHQRIQSRRLLSFGLVVLLFSLVSIAGVPFNNTLKSQSFTSLPEPKFPQPHKKETWADSFRKAETLRMNASSSPYLNYQRISQNCKDSSILALSFYRLSQLENQPVYAENFINKALQLYPQQEDFLMMKANVLEKSFRYNESWPIRSQLIRLKPRYISRYMQGIYTATMSGLDDSAEYLRNAWKNEFGGKPPEGFVKFSQKPSFANKTVQTVHNELDELEKKIILVYKERELKTFIQLTEEFDETYPFLSAHQKCHNAMYLELTQKCSEAKNLWHAISNDPDNIPSNYKSLQHLCP